MKVKFKKVSSLAHVPTKSTLDSACYDVYSARDVQPGPGVTKTVELDLASSSRRSTVVEFAHNWLIFEPIISWWRSNRF